MNILIAKMQTASNIFNNLCMVEIPNREISMSIQDTSLL